MIEMHILCFFLLIFFSFGLQQHFAQRNLFLLFESARIFFFVYTFVFLSLILEMILAKLYSYIDFERVQSVSQPNAMFIFLLTSSFFKKVAQILLVLLLFCYSSSEVVPLVYG